jgi:hypothetical protein
MRQAGMSKWTVRQIDNCALRSSRNRRYGAGEIVGPLLTTLGRWGRIPEIEGKGRASATSSSAQPIAPFVHSRWELAPDGDQRRSRWDDDEDPGGRFNTWRVDSIDGQPVSCHGSAAGIEGSALLESRELVLIGKVLVKSAQEMK